MDSVTKRSRAVLFRRGDAGRTPVLNQGWPLEVMNHLDSPLYVSPVYLPIV